VKGLSRETRVLLERGRGGRLDPDHRARLKKAVLAEALGVSVGITTSTVGWAAAAAKALGVLALVGAATGLVVVSTGTHGASRGLTPPIPAARSSNVAPPERTATTERAPETGLGTRLASNLAPAPAAPPTPAPPPPAPPPSVGDAPPGVQSSLEARVAPRAPSISASAPALPGPSALEEEARLLREANASLQSGDVDHSLALLEEHASRFPTGLLAPERSAVHVLALCQAGRIEQARAESTAFLEAHSEGPLSMRVRSSCGVAKR